MKEKYWECFLQQCACVRFRPRLMQRHRKPKLQKEAAGEAADERGWCRNGYRAVRQPVRFLVKIGDKGFTVSLCITRILQQTGHLARTGPGDGRWNQFLWFHQFLQGTTAFP